MKPTLLMFFTLLALPAASFADGGSWSRTAAGGNVSIGKQVLRSRALVSPASVPVSAHTVRISWHVTLLSPPPPGLAIKLCRSDKCIPLPSLSGTLDIDTPLSPVGEFRFIYSVNSLGQLRPALNVVSNQLTVNYR